MYERESACHAGGAWRRNGRGVEDPCRGVSLRALAEAQAYAARGVDARQLPHVCADDRAPFFSRVMRPCLSARIEPGGGKALYWRGRRPEGTDVCLNYASHLTRPAHAFSARAHLERKRAPAQPQETASYVIRAYPFPGAHPALVFPAPPHKRGGREGGTIHIFLLAPTTHQGRHSLFEVTQDGAMRSVRLMGVAAGLTYGLSSTTAHASVLASARAAVVPPHPLHQRGASSLLALRPRS